jgi:hypothetical protein
MLAEVINIESRDNITVSSKNLGVKHLNINKILIFAIGILRRRLA